ncbi:hypothetical protein K439DRAFT_1615704 [Ramaria rubella]|nr:hypothetical protein K439DRAFT_1615704 [Ramaria rubella]
MSSFFSSLQNFAKKKSKHNLVAQKKEAHTCHPQPIRHAKSWSSSSFGNDPQYEATVREIVPPPPPLKVRQEIIRMPRNAYPVQEKNATCKDPDRGYKLSAKERARYDANMISIGRSRQVSGGAPDPSHPADERGLCRQDYDIMHSASTIARRNRVQAKSASKLRPSELGSRPPGSRDTLRADKSDRTPVKSPYGSHPGSKSGINVRSRSTPLLLSPGSPVTAETAYMLYPQAIHNAYCRYCHDVPPSRTRCPHGMYNPM